MTTNVGSIDPTKTSDHYDLDDIDVGAPARVCYVVPAQAAAIIKVTLSMKMLPFRSTVSLNPSTIGTDATGSSGHSHSHAHTLAIAGGLAINENLQVESTNGAGPLGTPGGAFNDNATVQANAAGESGHSHSHSHVLTGTSAQAVTDGRTGVINALLVDGIDQTVALGGPWTGDVVEMDISSVFAKAPTAWHVLSLVPDGLTRVVSLLRIYYTT